MGENETVLYIGTRLSYTSIKLNEVSPKHMYKYPTV